MLSQWYTVLNEPIDKFSCQGNNIMTKCSNSKLKTLNQPIINYITYNCITCTEYIKVLVLNVTFFPFQKVANHHNGSDTLKVSSPIGIASTSDKR